VSGFSTAAVTANLFDSGISGFRSFNQALLNFSPDTRHLTPETFFSANHHFFDDNFFLQCYDNFDSNLLIYFYFLVKD